MSHITKSKAAIKVSSMSFLERVTDKMQLQAVGSSKIGFNKNIHDEKVKSKINLTLHDKEKSNKNEFDLTITIEEDSFSNHYGEIDVAGDFYYTRFHSASNFIKEFNEKFIKETIVEDLEEKGFELEEETTDTETDEIVWTFS